MVRLSSAVLGAALATGGGVALQSAQGLAGLADSQQHAALQHGQEQGGFPFFGHKKKKHSETYNGLPLYYKGHVPPDFFDMTNSSRQDFYYRIEKWHKLLVEWGDNCQSPQPGEKVVYLIQHGENLGNTISKLGSEEEIDAKLCPVGEEQARNLALDPMLAKALSADASFRPELIVTSPARKAMQTAIVGFQEILPNASWLVDADIAGFGLEGIHGQPRPNLGTAMLEEFGRDDLLKQYRELPAGWAVDGREGKKKWEEFVGRLKERPEHTIAIITHNQVIKLAGYSKVHAGEVRVAALTPSGEFRRLSPPDCWPQEAP